MPATSVEEALYTLLTSDSAFTAAVGGLYWRHAPEGTEAPFVVYWQVDDPRAKEMLCYYGGEARVQFDVYDTDAGRGLESTQRVIEKVREFRGLNSGLRMHGAVANVLTQPNAGGLLHKSVDVIIRYTEEA